MQTVDITRVVGKNFLSFLEFDADLDKKGVVSIEGENLDANGSDSNGSGKSSFVNAIIWCLYDYAGKVLKADSVVNKKAKGNCFVSVYTREGDDEHRFTRYRKHTQFKNAFTIENRNAGGNWKDITPAGPAQQKLAVQRIIGADLEAFEASCFVVQKKAIDIPGLTDSKLKGLLEETIALHDFSDCYIQAKSELDKLKSDISELEKKEAKLEAKIQFIKDEGKAALKLKQGWLDSWKREKLDNITILKNKLANYNNLNFGDINLFKSEKERLEKAIAEYDPKKLYEVDAKLKLISDKLDNLTTDLYKLQNDSECSKCGTFLKDNSKLVATLEAEIKALYDDEDELIKKHDLLNKDKIVYKSRETNLLTINRKLLELELQQKAAKETEATIKAVEASLSTPPANPHAATITRLTALLGQHKDELAKVSKTLDELNDQLEVKLAVVEVFSPTGLRYHLLEEATPILNERTNYYLKQLTDGSMEAIWSTVSRMSDGKYKEKFSIDIRFNGVNEYGALSGGEQRKVQLACFLGLQDVIAQRASKSINLWCCDEIDHALDTAGLERLCTLLHEKTKTKPTILVISHNQLREWIPNVAKVSKKDRISELNGFLNGKKKDTE